MSVPSAPQIRIRPRCGDGQITFRWQPPADDGGSAITAYHLTADGESPLILSPTLIDYTVTGLTNGTPYTFSLAAENGTGIGPAATYRTVQPGLLPSAPQNVVATKNAPGTITVNWDPATSDGGAAIGWYYVEAQSDNPSDPLVRKSAKNWYTSRRVGGLNVSSTYTVRMNAINDPGYGPSVFSDPIGFLGTWTRLNSPGTYDWNAVQVAQNAPNHVLAIPTDGTTAYIQKSSDGGVTWTELTGAGLYSWAYTNISANGAMIMLVEGGTLLMHISTDYGAIWSIYTTPLTVSLGFIAMSDDGTTIYMIDGGLGIRKSTNSGATWSLVYEDDAAILIACSADGSTVAYTGSGGNDLNLSIDGGATFSIINTTSEINALHMSAGGTTLAFMQGGYSNDGVIFVTTDSGANWTDTSAYAPNLFSSPSLMTMSRTNGSIFAIDILTNPTATITYTGDHGLTWSAVCNTDTYPNIISLATDASGSTLYSVFYTYYGARYVAKGARTDPGLATIAFTPGNNNFYFLKGTPDLSVIYALSPDSAYPSLYKSTDAGVTWTGIPTPTPFGKYPYGIISFTCASNGSTLYLAIGNYSVGGLMYTSTDSGATWSELTTVNTTGTGLFNLIKCSSNGSLLLYSRGGDYIYRSTDGGTTVTPITALGTDYWGDFAMSSDATIIYTNGFMTDTIYKSIDSGATWTALSSSTGHGNNGNTITSADGSVVATMSYFGPFYYASTDGGATFTEYTVPGSSGCTITGDSTLTTLYAFPSTPSAYFYISVDGGASFLTIPFTPYTGVNSIQALANSAGTELVLGTSGDRLYRYVA